MAVLFITGIDTDVGKTVVTGLLARAIMDLDKKVVTQKLVQTGCEGISEDIIEHRNIMGIDLLEEDKSYETCPYVFTFPASPHLAVEIDKKSIELNRIDQSTKALLNKYETVLFEGAGGLMVPIHKNYTIADFLEERKYPVILVSSPKLGSINHTLLTMEVLKKRKIPVSGIVYNRGACPNADQKISNDSARLFQELFPKLPFLILNQYSDTLKENVIDIQNFINKIIK